MKEDLPNPFENPAWMTNEKALQEHEAKEIAQVLNWVFAEKTVLADGTTRERAAAMATAEQIKLLRELEGDSSLGDDLRSDIRVLLDEVDRNKFVY